MDIDMSDNEDLKCQVCNDGDAIGVASSSLGPISFAYCNECAISGAEPYGITAAFVAINDGIDNFSEEFRSMVEATVSRAGKTMDEFHEDVSRNIELFESDLSKGSTDE